MERLTRASGTADPAGATVGPSRRAPADTGGAEARAGTGTGHLAAIDVIRFLTVGGVILVHSSSLANSQGSLPANAVLQLSHITRSVFLMLSAFVLTYSYDRRPLGKRAFWRRRFPLVAVPYVVWSAVYVLADGDLRSPLSVIGRFLLDLLDGGAHFHLYFLLLTFQLYLLFPALMAAARRWPRALAPALAASLVFQIGFDAAVHYGWRPAVLGEWFSHPSSWLPSYVLYIVGGIAAARHLDGVTAWVGSHRRVVGAAFAAACAAALVSYLADIAFLGYAPVKASEVFQPADVAVAVTAVAAQYALGMWVTERAALRRLRLLERSSDLSFGVFLAHPLVLAGVLDLAGGLGVAGAVASWPTGVVELIIFIGLVPFVYATSLLLIDSLRRTPVSLAFSGRRFSGRGAAADIRRMPSWRWLALAGLVIIWLVPTGGFATGSVPPARGATPAPAAGESQSQPVPQAPASPSPLEGATRSAVHWVQRSASLTYGGVNRTYLIYRPAQIQAARIPVVVELSGCCIAGPSVEADRADFRQVSGPAILVYPKDLEGSWDAGACCGRPAAEGVDDVGFVTEVISAVRAAEPDASQGPVYLAGYSNGGKLAMMLACDQPDLFAGVAVYGATRTSACSGIRPESVLLMAGSADPEDSIAGPPVVQNGFEEPTVDEMVGEYLAADRCSGQSRSVASGGVRETVWSACDGGREVAEAVWKGQGHAWPQAQGPTPSAQQVMWDWFSRLGA